MKESKNLEENEDREVYDPQHGKIGLEVIKLFSCSTQMSMKFIMLINVKIPTIKIPTMVGILTFMSMIN